jgi:hypothetical protein
MHCASNAASPDFSIISGKYCLGALSLIWRLVLPAMVTLARIPTSESRFTAVGRRIAKYVIGRSHLDLFQNRLRKVILNPAILSYLLFITCSRGFPTTKKTGGAL